VGALRELAGVLAEPLSVLAGGVTGVGVVTGGIAGAVAVGDVVEVAPE
jgi:hypothetical protein